MSRRGAKAHLSGSSEEEFVMVTPRGGAAAAAAAGSDAAPQPARVKGTAEEEAEYERKSEMAYRAELLGVDVPPVAPPGHILVQQDSGPNQVTFWAALFRRAENRTALQQLYFTTVLMVTLPLGLMALSYYALLPLLVPDDDDRLMWSAFAGVFGVNVVAIGFGLFAYYDKEDGEEEEGEIDGNSAEAMEIKRAKWSEWEKEQEAQQSREDQERLADIRARRDGLKGKDEAAASATGSAEAESSDDAPALRSRRSKSAKKDSALAETEAEAEAEQQQTATPKRARSKKA